MSHSVLNGLYVISGPSGVGKGTLCKYLLAHIPGLALSISVTSRPQRPGEQDGVDYYFVSREAFQQKIAQDAFLEWAEYNGHFYGTSQAAVEALLNAGKQVLLEIDVQGALQIKERYPQACLIFIEPPSLQALEERLRGRGTNDEADIQRRLTISKQELELQHHFTYRVMNESLSQCQQTVQQLLEDRASGLASR